MQAFLCVFHSRARCHARCLHACSNLLQAHVNAGKSSNSQWAGLEVGMAPLMPLSFFLSSSFLPSLPPSLQHTHPDSFPQLLTPAAFQRFTPHKKQNHESPIGGYCGRRHLATALVASCNVPDNKWKSGAPSNPGFLWHKRKIKGNE